MVLQTVSKQGVETFQDLGDRFNMVTKRTADKQFNDMLADQFGKNIEMAKDVFAIIVSYTPGIGDIYLYSDDWNAIFCTNGDFFLKIEAPVWKHQSNVNPVFDGILASIEK